MTLKRKDVMGVVLAGGQGRMGFVNKPLVDGGKLLSHILARISPQLDEIIINAFAHDAYRDYELEIVADELGGFRGHCLRADCDGLGGDE